MTTINKRSKASRMSMQIEQEMVYLAMDYLLIVRTMERCPNLLEMGLSERVRISPNPMTSARMPQNTMKRETWKKDAFFRTRTEVSIQLADNPQHAKESY